MQGVKTFLQEHKGDALINIQRALHGALISEERWKIEGKFNKQDLDNGTKEKTA